MGEFFGTDGIRGKAGCYPLDAPTIEKIGWSLTRELARRNGHAPLLVVGRDTRESGEWIEQAMARGAMAAGATMRSAGVIPTPGVACLTRLLAADAGIVISASHNPYEDNGIKVFSPSGQKLDEEAEQTIENDLKAPAENFPAFHPSELQGELQGKLQADANLAERYLLFLLDEAAQGLRLAGMRIAVDCANGAAAALAPRLFTRLGATVIPINVDPNGRNINLGCGSLHPENLQHAVRDHKAALGIAFDGDADRSLYVDEDGNLIDGDQVLYVMGVYLSRRNQLAGGRVIATVMSNLGLEIGLKQHGIGLARTNVGDKYVLDELLKNGGSVGGEQSGHIIFPGISLAGDGMLTALELLRVIRETGQTLGKLTRDFVRYPQVTINVKVARKPALETVPAIQAAVDKLEAELDGRGRLLLRYSGTENVARVMIEGPDETTVRAQAEAMAEIIRENLS
ncbi:MAG: phosphoglucosamine mutase [Blastocatellia bacterium]